jgi:hypothetical protein
MKNTVAVAALLVTASTFAQDKPLPYSELGALGSVLRIEPGTVAKKAGTAAMNATPTEAAAGVAGAYVGYKTLRFAGQNPMLAGSALTLGYLVQHPNTLDQHVAEHPDDIEKVYSWLEQQKAANPSNRAYIEQLQNRAVAISAQARNK